jgi:hypothetical protein
MISVVNDGAPEVERVQRAVAAALARSTARLRHRLVMNAFGQQHVSEGAGTVDFANVRYEISDGEHPQIVDRDDRYTPQPGGPGRARY